MYFSILGLTTPVIILLLIIINYIISGLELWKYYVVCILSDFTELVWERNIFKLKYKALQCKMVK